MAVLLLATACNAGFTQAVAGDAVAGTSGDAGPATSASLDQPGPIVAIPSGGFYVLDQNDCVLRKVDADGIISTVAGIANKCAETADPTTGGSVATATAIEPGTIFTGTGVGLDDAGNVYFVENSDRIRRVTPDGTLTTYVDVRQSTGTSTIVGLAVAGDGTVYYNHFLGFATGTHVEARSTTGVTRVVASLSGPAGGLALAGEGTLVTREAADFVSPALLETIDIATGSKSTAIDMQQLGFDATGHTLDALLALPPVASPDGTIYQVNMSRQIVRINPDHTFAVIAGTGNYDDGSVVQSGLGTSLNLSPTGLGITPNGGLLIASGHVVYRLNDPAHAG
jgi:serine/threonine-protein kinase